MILHTQNLSDDYLIELESKGIPLVLVNRFIPELASSCIDIDNELGGRMATEYLLQRGHHSIACITGPLDKSDARGRLQGYRKALEAAGMSMTRRWCPRPVLPKRVAQVPCENYSIADRLFLRYSRVTITWRLGLSR